jgi:predicted nucleic acid-binding Zn ribbon protein
MNERINTQTLDDFRAANCKAASCEECGNNRMCLPYYFFSAVAKCSRTDIEVAVGLLEGNGFHVTDAREERSTSTDKGHVIDERGVKTTGAILLRAVPVTPATA